jgi:F-box/TPR repeat protein Pof3
MKAIDSKRLAYITKYCKNLKELQMHGSGMIADSLALALKDAKELETLYVSRNTEITLSAVQTALGQCKNTLVTATFLKITGPRGGFLYDRWPAMPSIKTLHLESDGQSVLDLVSLTPELPRTKRNLTKLSLARS